MKLEKLTLRFENCEQVEIPGECVGDFVVDKIKTKFEKYGINYMSKNDYTYKVLLEIIYRPGLDKIFERIQMRDDITWIDFTLLNKGVKYEYSYAVGWIDDVYDTCNNLMQISGISNLGNLYVVIDKKLRDKNIWDYFEKNVKNNEKIMNMYQI